MNLYKSIILKSPNWDCISVACCEHSDAVQECINIGVIMFQATVATPPHTLDIPHKKKQKNKINNTARNFEKKKFKGNVTC